MSYRSWSLRAGLPPLGSMATPVVLAGSSTPRPTWIKATNSSSFLPATNSLVVRSLPRFLIPWPVRPWQAAQVPANSFCPFTASPLGTGAAGAPQAARPSVAVMSKARMRKSVTFIEKDLLVSTVRILGVRLLLALEGATSHFFLNYIHRRHFAVMRHHLFESQHLSCQLSRIVSLRAQR